jgi:hypothetical protein
MCYLSEISTAGYFVLGAGKWQGREFHKVEG